MGGLFSRSAMSMPMGCGQRSNHSKKTGNPSLQTTIISCTFVLDIMISYSKALYQVLWFLIVCNFQQNNVRHQCYTILSTKYNSSFTDMSLQLMLKDGVHWTPGVLKKTICFRMSGIHCVFSMVTKLTNYVYNRTGVVISKAQFAVMQGK